MDYIVRVDETGRVIIPKKVRNRYGMEADDVLLLNTGSNGFSLKKECMSSKYRSLIRCVKFLENKYNVRVVITDSRKVVYESNGLFVGSVVSKDIRRILDSNNIFKYNGLRISDGDYIDDVVICKGIFDGIYRGCVIFVGDFDFDLCKMLFDVIG